MKGNAIVASDQTGLISDVAKLDCNNETEPNIMPTQDSIEMR